MTAIFTKTAFVFNKIYLYLTNKNSFVKVILQAQILRISVQSYSKKKIMFRTIYLQKYKYVIDVLNRLMKIKNKVLKF